MGLFWLEDADVKNSVIWEDGLLCAVLTLVGVSQMTSGAEK